MLADVIQQVFAEVQLRLDLVIALEQLNGVPTQEAVIDLALDGLLDVGDGMLNTAGKDVGQLNALGGLGSGDRSLGSLLAALALQGGDLNSLAAQLLGELSQLIPGSEWTPVRCLRFNPETCL